MDKTLQQMSVEEMVANARSAGSSWSRIGELLDMTAEAAEARFG